MNVLLLCRFNDRRWVVGDVAIIQQEDGSRLDVGYEVIEHKIQKYNGVTPSRFTGLEFATR